MTDKIVICRQTKDRSIVPLIELTPKKLECMKDNIRFAINLTINPITHSECKYCKALLKELESLSDKK